MGKKEREGKGRKKETWKDTHLFRRREVRADDSGEREGGCGCAGPQGRAGCGWRKSQRWPPGLRGPDKDACQREAGEGKTFTDPRGRKPGRLPQAPENNRYLTSAGH